MNNYTIRDLLASDSLPGMRLMAGRQNINFAIENVNIIENLDSYDWLRAGDFLLTTGFIYKDDPQQLIHMIERLARINCAGLGFKIKRYFDSCPYEMLQRANELGFPIIEIPQRYSLADVSNEISNALRNNATNYLTQYLRIHNSFNRCALNGGGANALIGTLYQFVKNPVLLLDSRWRLLARCDPEKKLAALGLNEKRVVFPQTFLGTIPEKLTGKTKIVTRTYPDEQGSLVVRIALLEDENSLYGYVLVFETEHQTDYLGFLALESATIPLVLERVKAKQLNEVKHQLRQDFFDDLLQGKIESVNAASSLAEIHHMDIRNIYLCMIIRLEEDSNLQTNVDEKRNRLLKLREEIISGIDRVSIKLNMETISIYRSNLIITFILVRPEKKTLHVWEILGDFPEFVSQEIKKISEIPFVIGIGTPIEDYLKLRVSYFQANEAIQYGYHGESGEIYYYENFMVDQLLDSVRDKQILETFAQMSLGKLCEHDQKHGTDFVKTLEIYFECNGNVSIAAKKLFLHRNSLIYRMDKIKEILGSELKDSTELLTLQVGLHVLRLLNR